MRREDLRLRLEELYRQYDQRFVTPDPLEFVRAQVRDADREVVGMLASGKGIAEDDLQQDAVEAKDIVVGDCIAKD